jgi:hypothetical protein
MSSCEIIEDCSPYYIRFKFEGLDQFIELCRNVPLPERGPELRHNVRHVPLDIMLAEQLISMLPFASKIQFNKTSARIFLTEPGVYYGAHKDGLPCKVSFNFAISILDDKCVTSWYDENELSHYTISNNYIPSLDFYVPAGFKCREILNWDKSKHIPVKTMIMQPNEVVLFNTDIYHAWDNSQSSNRRMILTLRHIDPDKLSFEDAKNIVMSS